MLAYADGDRTKINSDDKMTNAIDIILATPLLMGTPVTTAGILVECLGTMFGEVEVIAASLILGFIVFPFSMRLFAL